MLQEIYISNFILIDQLRIEFGEGYNVLSGETGAGKSIIIDAMGLIMGERVKNDWIRDSSRKAIAEAVFILSEESKALLFLRDNNLIEDDEDTLIISREISPSGRSQAKINGRNVTAGILKELAGLLLDMHLQHEHLSILKPDKYLEYLDGFTHGAENLLIEVKNIYESIKHFKEKLKMVELNQQDKLEKLEFLKYQIEEIKNADLREGEEEELQLLRARIKNTSRLLEGTDRVLNLLYSNEAGRNAYDLISSALDTVNNLKAEDFFAGLSNNLEEIYYSLQDIALKLASFRETLDLQPQQLEEVEDRIYLISRLRKKYGGSIREVLTYLDKAVKEVQLIDVHQETKAKLQELIAQLEQDYEAKARELTHIRAKAAKIIEQSVNAELKHLNMPHVRFAITLQPRVLPTSSGMDQVEFLFSPNPGEPLRPVSQAASGGEISRLVLALKTVLAQVYEVPTMIFDEIDVGVGGTSLTAMARKLRQIASNHQVILVTHSAQTAVYADIHYLIQKQVVENNTFTRVKLLDKKGREQEIARMLAGDNFSLLTLEHAREMLYQANKEK
ncbi:MAG: DNA repair protein RecN [Syntrophomonadaceae bacterium]|jgi:DNA repair protein RecN (Recombination protein N)